MITFDLPMRHPARVHLPTTTTDGDTIVEWAAAAPLVAFDTETTGLDPFAADWRLRTVQVGDATESYVLPMPQYEDVARRILQGADGHLAAHNATFDALAVGVGLGVDLQIECIVDTMILSHLLDTRSQFEGGVGHGLKALALRLVDAYAEVPEKELKALFRTSGWRAEEGWSQIEVTTPEFVRYAGLDAILVARLVPLLQRKVEDLDMTHLGKFEFRVQAVTARMMRAGMLVDDDYTRTLDRQLADEATHFAQIAHTSFGVSSVSATKQVADTLRRMGETLSEVTPTGATKVDRSVLLSLADLNPAFERIGARDPNILADAVVRAKRATKWRASYVTPFLTARDADGRIHPAIASLQARTGRMSVSRPPLQQLPAGDSTIRRCLIAAPGHVLVSADYSQVELRVLAALSGDPTMIAAFVAGEDLHARTARWVFGDDFTDKHRKLAKGVAFGKVFGGGPATIARQTGADIDAVRHALAQFDRLYPKVARFAKSAEQAASVDQDRAVVTATGRRIILDGDRMYAAVNYLVQSTARDILAEAILRLADTWLGQAMRLPIHDEVLFEVPEEDATRAADDALVAMRTELLGVPVVAEAEVLGHSWGG